MPATDKITASVIQRRLFFINEQMGEAMLRTAYSQILNASRDFSTGMFDGDCRLIAQAEHIPLHVGALPFALKSVVEFFKGRIHPGDVLLLNDPYHGGNHLPDLTCFVPVFIDSRDEPAFWTVNRAHQSDIGGAAPGSYNPAATDIWQEGIRITPIKLYDRGILRDDVLEMIATNVRHKSDFKGDLSAMIGAAQVGARRFEQLVHEYGLDVVTSAVDRILDSSEMQVRACIRNWTDGVYQGESFMDDDAIRACINGVMGEFGRIDGLFNNAGYGNMSLFLHTDLEEYDRMFAINTRSIASFMQAVIPHMKAAGGGAIVNNASLGGIYASAHLSAYETSKFALVGLSKSVALEVGADNIRVNLVCPGAIDTEMGAKMPVYYAEHTGVSEEQSYKAIAKDAALGRWGRPEEVAEVVAFLLSDLSSYMTGAAVPVSGGSPQSL